VKTLESALTARFAPRLLDQLQRHIFEGLGYQRSRPDVRSNTLDHFDIVVFCTSFVLIYIVSFYNYVTSSEVHTLRIDRHHLGQIAEFHLATAAGGEQS
jgi:hypothetical protein